MEALLAAQSALHWLAVFGSAAADCASANSPTNFAHTAAVKVGFITRLRENLPERFGGSVGEKGTAALATATDPQPLTGSRACSLFSSVKTNRERRAQNNSGALRRRCCFWIRSAVSVRGQGRRVRVHRRLGAHRSLRRLGLLLIPLDCLGFAHQRARQNLVHARDRN